MGAEIVRVKALDCGNHYHKNEIFMWILFKEIGDDCLIIVTKCWYTIKISSSDITEEFKIMSIDWFNEDRLTADIRRTK